MERKETGFLGLGEGKIRVDVVASNDGDEGGTFAINVKAGLEGQPKSAAITLGTRREFIGPHAQITKSFDYPPQSLKNLSVLCTIDPPQVIQQSKDICSTCGGSGTITP